MIKILVPSDFSENAEKALQFAIELAKKDGGFIHLHHVYKVPSTTGSLISVERYISQDAEDEMQRLIKRLKPELPDQVILDYTVVNGSIVSSVCNKANKDGYDLIVMGTTGASGLKGKLFGSNTASMLNKTEVPLLAVPQDAEIRDIKHIVAAIDDHPISDKDKFKVINQIQQWYQAKTTVFHLDKAPNNDNGIDPSVAQSLNYDQIETATVAENQSIPETIDQFAAKAKADLLCMVKRKRGWWAKLMNPSITKLEISASAIPLLILLD